MSIFDLLPQSSAETVSASQTLAGTTWNVEVSGKAVAKIKFHHPDELFLKATLIVGDIKMPGVWLELSDGRFAVQIPQDTTPLHLSEVFYGTLKGSSQGSGTVIGIDNMRPFSIAKTS